jgi:hypothetical protein
MYRIFFPKLSDKITNLESSVVVWTWGRESDGHGRAEGQLTHP